MMYFFSVCDTFKWTQRFPCQRNLTYLKSGTFQCSIDVFIYRSRARGLDQHLQSKACGDRDKQDG